MFDSQLATNSTTGPVEVSKILDYFNYEEVEKLKREVAAILGNLTLVQEEHEAIAQGGIGNNDMQILIMILVLALTLSGAFIFCAFCRSQKMRVE
jgi:hypothetical protein